MVGEMFGHHGSQIVCREVTRVYGDHPEGVVALTRIDAEFRRGEISAVVGPSGSGKSTLLRIVAAIDRPTSGSVLIRGRDVARLGRGPRRRIRRLDIGYVYQDPAANLLGYMTVIEHVCFGADLRVGRGRSEASDLLEAFGLAALADRLPAQLSSGQQQLVSFVAAVAGSPIVVIADEPTAELDDSSSQIVLESLRTMRDLGICVIVATHDPAAVRTADRVFRLHHGQQGEH